MEVGGLLEIYFEVLPMDLLKRETEKERQYINQ